MTKMPSDVQRIFKEVDNVVLSTSRDDGQPNSCIVGMKSVIDSETLYLSDQFFNKTLDNLRSNPKVSIVFWRGIEAYEIYGRADYVSEGPSFDEQKAWVDAEFEEMGMPMRAKGGCFVHVESVFSSTPGPTAGDLIV